MEFKHLLLDIGRTWSPVSSSTRPTSSKSSTTSSSPSSVSNLAGRFSKWTTKSRHPICKFYSNSDHDCHRSAHAQSKWSSLLGMWTNWVNWVNLWTWTDCPSQNQWQSKFLWCFPNTAFWPFLTFSSSDTTESWLEGKVQPLHARWGAGDPSKTFSHCLTISSNIMFHFIITREQNSFFHVAASSSGWR